MEVFADDFEDTVVKSTIPVIVDFWGPQCVPCLELMPQVEELGEKFDGKIKLAKVDASKNRRLCLNLKVLSLPTILYYKDGKEVDRLTGAAVTIEAIESAIKNIIE